MLPAALPLLAAGVPAVTLLLGVECWRPLSRRDRSLLARSERLLAISKWTRERFLAANPTFSESDLTVCWPGVEMTPILPTQPRRGRALVVGRLWCEERYKGHDALIDVWPALQRACPGAELIVVGDGDDRPRLEARARSIGAGDAIRFIGLVSREQLLQEFSDAQLFVLPSGGEGFGLVFLEAMRAGRPCLAAPGAAEEIVVNGVTGRVVSPHHHDALRDALIELLNDPEQCATLGRAGRARFEREFSRECFARRFLAAVEPANVAC
jgi:phosphatidylinositol alpha-1,6-mannosyltransferase